ncbi:MAG: protein-L-isoaspartate(D-aspartate) O-methyltransferase [Pirellulales bacterium]|nr:protein-L-isoaspartate(D-aspartate) O-methyltransferase [Pirellulales bacterium]
MNRFAHSCGVVLTVAAIGTFGFTAAAPAQRATTFEDARNQMVDTEIVDAGVKDPRVIQALRAAPRHEFVPPDQRRYAYFDMALPIGNQQTISAPFVVAYMTEQIDPKPDDSVLEIGTGSGYQAAVLSPLVKDVYTIEIVEPLGRRAAQVLRKLKYDNVHCKIGDGYQGWPEHAPFDKIIVTCSPEAIPPALADQLKEGGRMVIPIGQRYQQTLLLVTKKDGELVRERLLPILFVPMTGTAESERKVQPDPAHPALENGDFEQSIADEPTRPAGWHYQRQLERVEAADAPSGGHVARFANDERGRSARALQGLAIDGRKVPRILISMRVRGRDIRPGPLAYQVAGLAITFYDANRQPLGEDQIGPWQGTFAWRREARVIPVPPAAREAMVRIGLFGATGQLEIDQLELKPAPGRP